MNTRLNTRLNAKLNTKMQKTSYPNSSNQYSTLESEMKRETTNKQLNPPNELYTVDINFDEASDEWHANKKRVGHNYVYICEQTVIKTGTKCNKVCYKDGLTCFIHKNIYKSNL
jgi:hypothetical protein